MPSDEFDDIEARLGAATPGPWHIEITEEAREINECDVVSERGGFKDGPFCVAAVYMGREDGPLIAHAPTDLRRLLDRVRELEGRARSPCYCCAEDCQPGCRCYGPSGQKDIEEEWERRAALRGEGENG